MEGRRYLDDHGDDLRWGFPPRENNNLHHPITTSQQSYIGSQILYFDPIFQEPNQQDYLVQNPILQNPTTQNQLIFHLNYSNKLPSVEPSTWHHQIPENGLSMPSQSAASPPPPSQYLPCPTFYQNGLSLPTSFPLQNYETIDLQSCFESLKIDGFPRPNKRNLVTPKNRYATTNNARTSYSNLSYGFLSDHRHLGSSINASAGYSNFDARARHRHHRLSYSSIEELRGRIFLVAKDVQGCSFLQEKVDERNPVDIEMILSEVKDNLHELMTHESANSFIQKLIGVLNEEQMTKLILSVVSSQQRLFSICDNLTGYHSLFLWIFFLKKKKGLLIDLTFYFFEDLVVCRNCWILASTPCSNLCLCRL